MDLALNIKPKFVGAEPTQRAADKLGKSFADHDKHIKAAETALRKYVKTANAGFVDMERGAIRAGRGFREAFDIAGRGVDRLAAKFKKLEHGLLDLRTLIAGTFAFEAGKKLFELGREEYLTKAKLRREFGEDSEKIERLVGGVAGKAGLEESQARAGVTPIARAVDVIQAGYLYKGGAFGSKYAKKAGRLNEQEASQLRERNLSYLTNLYGQVATLNPDMDQETLGLAVANAGSGKEGLRQLIGMLRLPRNSRNLFAAAEKGKLYDSLTKEEIEKYHVQKGSKEVLPGTLLSLILDRAKQGSKEADDYRKNSPEFATRKAHAAITQRLAAVGEKLYDVFAKVVTGNVKGAAKDVLGAAKDHPILAALGVAGAGLVGRYVFKKFLGGKGGGGIEGLAGAGGAIPVFVTNWGGGGGGGGLPSGAREITLDVAKKAATSLLGSGAASAVIGGAILAAPIVAGVGAGLYYMHLKEERRQGEVNAADSAANSATNLKGIAIGRTNKALRNLKGLSLAESLLARSATNELEMGLDSSSALAFSKGGPSALALLSGKLRSKGVSEQEANKIAGAVTGALSQQFQLTIGQINVQGAITPENAHQAGKEVERALKRKMRMEHAHGAAPTSRQ